MTAALPIVIALATAVVVTLLPGVNGRRVTCGVALALTVSVLAMGRADRYFRVDGLALVFGVLVTVVGYTVTAYAARQFADETRARGILATSLLTLAGALATDLARSPSVLVVSWVATSVSVVVTLHVATRDAEGGVTLLAARSLLLGDAPLVALALSGRLSGGGSLAHDTLWASAALAAAARAGLGTRRSWVAATVQAPTSTSALLHAGLVNSGLVLLWRLGAVSRPSAAVAWGVALVFVAAVVGNAPRVGVRVDLKGQLAVSTVSQMGFMLATLALGWPALALAHAVGHGAYKAARFLGAGDAIISRSSRRHRAVVVRGVSSVRTLAAVAVMSASAVLAGGLGGRDAAASAAVVVPALWAGWYHLRARGLHHGVVVAGALTALIYPLVVSRLVLVVPALSAASAPWWAPAVVIALAWVTVTYRPRGRRLAGTLDVPSLVGAMS